MRIGSPNIVVDTYAWIEYFRGTVKGEAVKRYLLSARGVYTPSIVLAEIARKYLREGFSRDAVSEKLKVIANISTIIPIDTELALEAGEAYLELLEHSRKQKLKQKPSLNDAIVLATARRMKAKVVTGDQHFKNLRETLWVGD